MCLNCGDWICESEVCVAAEKARADQQATAGIPWRQRHFINYHDPAVERLGERADRAEADLGNTAVYRLAIERGKRVGLHDYVAKFDRQGLIAALKEQTADMRPGVGRAA